MVLRSLRFIPFMLVLASASAGVYAAEWYVDVSISTSGDGTSPDTAFKTIGEGMTAASDGDEIAVAPGAYIENVVFAGNNIILRSTHPADPAAIETTIIDGNAAAPAITFAGTEDETCVLSGFTIRNGMGINGGGICGGTAAHHTLATLENNIIAGNSAGNGGGLAYCDGDILNNTITDNHADQLGGGLFGCGGIIQNNRVTDNSADFGGGLHSCQATVQNNIISGNSASLNGGGMCGCDGEIRNNVISANPAGACGGGLLWCNGTIQNNTITGNSAAGSGGGLAGCAGPIQNCVIWANAAPDLAQLDEFGAASYCCIQDWFGDGDGNIGVDPQFVDADGPDDDPDTYEDNDYRLTTDSPCIDAGKNEDWMAGAVDLNDDPRIAFGGTSLTVDMGAYEHYAFKIAQGVYFGKGGLLIWTWASRPDETYVVYSCLDILTGAWMEEASVPSEGATTFWSEIITTERKKFYRVELK